jgi:hypothetical protein
MAIPSSLAFTVWAPRAHKGLFARESILSPWVSFDGVTHVWYVREQPKGAGRRSLVILRPTACCRMYPTTTDP